jgi:hypothetical protein
MKLLGIVIVGLPAIFDEASGDVYLSVRGASVRMQTVAMNLLIIDQALHAFQPVVKEYLLHDVSATAWELWAFEESWELYLQVIIAMPPTHIMPESAGGVFSSTQSNLSRWFSGHGSSSVLS